MMKNVLISQWLEKELDWLINEQDIATGDLVEENCLAGNGMYSHGIGALAMVEAYGVTKDTEIRPYAQAAIDFIADSQHEEGGGDTDQMNEVIYLLVDGLSWLS